MRVIASVMAHVLQICTNGSWDSYILLTVVVNTNSNCQVYNELNFVIMN